MLSAGSGKVLVTGAAGFIGSHLVERLLVDGYRVIALDNLSNGRLGNLNHLFANAALEFHQVDIVNVDSIESHFEEVDWVFHLAGLADIVPSVQRPMAYHRANVDGSIAVLEAARLARVKRFVYAASSSCYGIPDSYPTPESAPVRPIYPYALTKLLGEQYVMHWAQVYKLGSVSLRLFNVYGPRSRTSGTYGAVFGVFLAQKLAGKPLTVVGDGMQTRDFTFVTDVADAFMRAAASDCTGEIFNIGSGNTYSINQLVGLLGGKVVYVPKRPGEPDCTFADIAKARRMLDWRPTVSFEEGVRTMTQRIEDWRGAPVWDQNSVAEATADWFKYLSV